MASYLSRKLSDLQYSGCSKLLVNPADGTHDVLYVPKNTLIKEVTVVKQVIGGVYAVGTLTMATIPTATDTVTIGTTVYTFVETPASSGDVAHGANVGEAQVNLVTAINAGDTYNTAHADYTAADFASDDMVITAIVRGAASDATEETFTDLTDAWGAATVESGAESTITIGFKGNDETADVDAFMISSVFSADSLGCVSSLMGAALFAGGKHFTRNGIITVTTANGGGTSPTFQVFVDYVRLNK